MRIILGTCHCQYPIKPAPMKKEPKLTEDFYVLFNVSLKMFHINYMKIH